MKIVLLPALASLLLQAADAKLPVPAAADQKKAEKSIRDLLKENYTKKDRNSKRVLAQKLLETARSTKDDAAMMFVLFKETAEVSAEAADFEGGIAAIVEIENRFAVEPTAPLTGATLSARHEMRKDLLKRGVKFLTGAEDGMAYVKACLKLADSFYDLDYFDEGLDLSQMAETAARNVSDAGLHALARSYVRKHGELKKAHDKVLKAHLAVLQDPADPKANTAWGEFLFFVKGDFERGLAALGKGEPGPLKTLAEKEASKADPMELAEGWIAYAEKAKREDKGRYQKRAIHWLERASAANAGVERLKVDQKIRSLEDAMGVVDLMALVDPRKDIVLGRPINKPSAQMDGKVLVFKTQYWDRLDLQYIPPLEYDLELVFQRPSGGHCVHLGLSDGRRQWSVALGGWFDPPGVHHSDGKSMPLDEATKEANKVDNNRNKPPAVIVIAVRKTGFVASLNGKELIDWSGDFSRLSLHPNFPSSKKSVLFVGSTESQLYIHKLKVTPVTGVGQKLR